MRRPAGRHLLLGAVALALGVAVLLYRGPSRAFVRGHLGDVAAAMLVLALLSLVWRARPVARAAATFAIATAVELGQTWWRASSTAGELLLGSTFDPWDLIAYVAGIALALAWDRGVSPGASRDRRDEGPPTPGPG